MGSTDAPFRHAPSGDPGPDRLDSWKEIANYLRRDVRTVQRWEKTARLPVHRHSEGRLRATYAYRSEIDAWWRDHEAAVDASPPDPPQESSGQDSVAPQAAGGLPPAASSPAPSRDARSRRWGIALTLGALLAVLALPALRSPDGPRSSPSADRRRVEVILLPMDDDLPDAAVAQSVQETIARELTADGRIELLPPSRIAAALRLMRRDPGVPLDQALGREVALRDGAVRWVIAARLHTLHSQYYADLQAIEPADGRVRASLEWRVRRIEDLADAAPGHTAELVRRLPGDETGAAGGPALAAVTSTSLSAVQLYTAAVRAGMRHEWGAAESLARRAVHADPEFPAALAWVGWAMRQQGRSLEQARPFLEAAVRLAPTVSEYEAHLINGAYHTVSGNLTAATSDLRALRRTNPGDRLALDMLAEVYFRTGRVNMAADVTVTHADLHPDDFHAALRAAKALTLAGRESDRAEAFAARARALLTPQRAREDPAAAAWLDGLPVFRGWSRGEAGVSDAIEAMNRQLVERVGRDRDSLAAAVGYAYLAYGRLADAERAFRHGVSPDRQLNLAMLALIGDDEPAARRWLLQVRQHSHRRPSLFARVGLEQDARRGLEGAIPFAHAEGTAAVTRGLILARAGRRAEAAVALRQGIDLLRSSGEPEYFLATEELARIAAANGERQRAITLLEMAAAERPHTYGASQWTGGYWAKLNSQLAAVYADAGRREDAERVRAGLRAVQLMPAQAQMLSRAGR
jgi:tetratricopeptide (TPR) repeat protein